MRRIFLLLAVLLWVTGSHGFADSLSHPDLWLEGHEGGRDLTKKEEQVGAHRGDKDVVSPRLLSGHSPKYPAQYRASRITGDVLVTFTVDTNGRVQDPQVVKTPDKGLGQICVDAVRDWRFAPARLHGKPVPVHFSTPFSFKVLQPGTRQF